MNDETLVERVALIPEKVKGEEWTAQPTKRSSESFRMTNALSPSEGRDYQPPAINFAGLYRRA